MSAEDEKNEVELPVFVDVGDGHKPDRQNPSKRALRALLWISVRENRVEDVQRILKAVDKSDLNAWNSARVCNADLHRSIGYKFGYGEW
jgi:hypothetical protein